MAQPRKEREDHTGEPFAPGSVSLGLYVHDLAPEHAVAHVHQQAVAADRAGFDGVTVSEHHAGQTGYLPNPLLAVSWLVGDLETAWAAACPQLLPLRPTGLVIEEVSWLAARFPGRIGAGFAPGWSVDDFTVLGSDYDSRRARYWEALRVVCKALREGLAEGPLARDPAVSDRARHPVAVVSSAAGPLGARRAARAGAGIVLGSFTPVERLRELIDEYARAGGTGPRIVNKRVWLGEPPQGAVESLLGRFRSTAGETDFFDRGSPGELICASAPAELAEQLASVVERSHATALGLRVHLPGSTPEQILEQIDRVGTEVLPLLRATLSGVAPRLEHADA